MKNSLEGLKIRFKITELKISELDKSIEMIQAEEKRPVKQHRMYQYQINGSYPKKE